MQPTINLEEHWAQSVFEKYNDNKIDYDLLLSHAQSLPQIQYALKQGAPAQSKNVYQNLCNLSRNTYYGSTKESRLMVCVLAEAMGEQTLRQHYQTSPFNFLRAEKTALNALLKTPIDWSTFSQTQLGQTAQASMIKELANHHHFQQLLQVLNKPHAYATHKDDVLKEVVNICVKKMAFIHSHGDPTNKYNIALFQQIIDVINKALSFSDIKVTDPILLWYTTKEKNVFTLKRPPEKTRTTKDWSKVSTSKLLKGVKTVAGVEEVIKRNINLNQRLTGGSYFLREAIRDQNIAVCETLLNAGADPNIVIPNSKSLLNLATIMGNEKIIKLLLDKGAKTDVLDDGGKSVWHIAATNRNPKSLDVLAPFIDIHIQDAHGRTALWYAPCLSMGHTKEMVEKLISLGLNPLHRDHQGNYFDVGVSSQFHGLFNDTYHIIRKSLQDYIPQLEAQQIHEAIQKDIQTTVSNPSTRKKKM